MKYINRATIQGMIGKDPEFKTTSGGLPVVNFSIATTRKIKEVDTTQWHRCVAFGKMADSIGQAVKKGFRIHVEGEIQYQDYEVEGIKRTSTKIVVTDASILIPYADDKPLEAYVECPPEPVYTSSKLSNSGFFSHKQALKSDLEEELPF